MQRSTIGIGPALRKARVARGLSIEEAARDTRIRAEMLDALEEEEFDRLLGEVYVRGCLRSYASYLGLSPDKTVARYAEQTDEAVPKPTVQPLALPASPAIGSRRRDNHRLIGMVAATVLILAAAFGLLSSRSSAPPPASLPAQAPSIDETQTNGIVVAVMAAKPVDVTVRADQGAPQAYHLRPGEGRSFVGDVSLVVRLSDGAAARVTVSGKDLGFPGKPGKPWKGTFSFGDETSPSPGG